jgi:hypothetical protein
MAINVNKVYRTVLSILNKEQRGYLTPDQFNRLARQVQLELLEKAFYDYNRALTRRNMQGVSSEYGDIAQNIKEKLDAFNYSEIIGVGPGGYTLSGMPQPLYRVLQLTSTDRSTIFEELKKSEIAYVNGSPLTAPSDLFPEYYQEDGKLYVLPTPTNITNVILDYIKLPDDPTWVRDTAVTTHYEYDDANSVDFELHPSEEPALVIKILAYAGVIIKDPLVIQTAQQEETNKFNKENS